MNTGLKCRSLFEAEYSCLVDSNLPVFITWMGVCISSQLICQAWCFRVCTWRKPICTEKVPSSAMTGQGAQNCIPHAVIEGKGLNFRVSLATQRGSSIVVQPIPGVKRCNSSSTRKAHLSSFQAVLSSTTLPFLLLECQDAQPKCYIPGQLILLPQQAFVSRALLSNLWFPRHCEMEEWAFPLVVAGGTGTLWFHPEALPSCLGP